MPEAPPPEPLGRSAWVVEFAGALRELRPELGLKFATSVALHEWPARQGMDPADAAKAWAARKGDAP